MPEETLYTAARRVVRNFNIDMQHGGLITEETEHSVGLLQKQLKAAENDARGESKSGHKEGA